MKFTLSEIKKNLQGSNSGEEKAEKAMIWNTRKEKAFNQSSKKKELKKNEDSLRNLWDNFKHTSVRIIGVPEGEEEEQEIEKF